MKKNLIKLTCLSLLLVSGMSNPVFAKNSNVPMNESSIEINIDNLEGKYGVELDLPNDITKDELKTVENEIKNLVSNVEKAKAELSIPEKVQYESLNRVSQNFSGTAVVDATLPAIGLYKVSIPYKYTVTTAGGAPFFERASAGVSYGSGVALGAYSHQSSWTTILSRNGRKNNVLEVNAKGTIVYSLPVGGSVTLPNQVFLKTFYL